VPIVRSGESEYDRELAKWDLPKRMGGYNADGFEPYPRMLYKAHRRENGKVMCMDMDALYGGDMAAVARAEAFNHACQKTVQSDEQYRIAKGQGWSDTPTDAIALHEREAQALATAAAEAAYSVQRMSEKARAEHAKADAATEHPLADVPAPKKAPKATRVAVAG
jgi:hypothetical protein